MTVAVTMGLTPKLADTVAAPLRMQVPVPVHAPPQPLKELRMLLLAAVSTTVVPSRKLPVQVAPGAQLMPVGELVTVPAPVTVTVTLKLARIAVTIGGAAPRAARAAG